MKTLAAALAIALAATSLPALAIAQEAAPAAQEAPAPEILDDVVLGDPAAPITIEEYASLTCVHCAAFSNEVMPELKERYIDTGKVKFVLKPFPLDAVSAGAFLLARCGTDEEFYPRVEHLFETQEQWITSSSPGDALLASMAEFGMDQAQYETCLQNKPALNWVVATRESAADLVTGTPTFVIDGIVSKGNMPIERFEEILEPLLAE